MPPPESRDFARQAEDGDEDGDGDEEEASAYKAEKDAILFAIEVSSSMLRPTPPADGETASRDSATMAALKCAYKLMQQRIISNPGDMMGIVLFGTEKSNTGDDADGGSAIPFPHCYILAQLDVPGASDVRTLRDLVQDEQEAEKLLVPSKEPVSIASVLFCCNNIFTTRAANFSSRRLFLVTDNDNPHRSDKVLRSAAAVRAKDLYDLGVFIELFPIAQPGVGFEREKFYDDVVYRWRPLDGEAPMPLHFPAKTTAAGDGISLLEALLTTINVRAVGQRALFTLPLEIGAGLTIGVKGFPMIKRQEVLKTCWIWVGGDQLQVAVGTTTNIAEDTARTVTNDEIRKAYMFGGEQLFFDDDDMKWLRYFGEPAINILGFKPLSMLPPWANTRTPTFLRAEETNFVGSSRVFSALYQKLFADQKFALAWTITRRNVMPILAALVPGSEKLHDSGEQYVPEGLWLVPLPYRDDIRQNPETPLVQAPARLVDRMKLVLNQMRLPGEVYDPRKYPNPALQWFYKVVQALALDEDIPPFKDSDDKTKPRYRQIQKRAGDLISDWAKELDSSFKEFEKSNHSIGHLPSRTAKRPGGDEEPQQSKRLKQTQIMPDKAMKEHYDSGTLSKLTVAVLSDWVKEKHIQADGKKKADLVAAIEQHFEGR